MPDKFDENLDQLKKMRDQIKLKAHLLGAEMKTEWEKLEGKWDKIEVELKPLKSATKKAGTEISQSTKTLMTEIMTGLSRIKKHLDK